jgi:hypothetical protein
MTAGMSLCLARRRPPTRRAIPTDEIVGRVNDFVGWYQSIMTNLGGATKEPPGFVSFETATFKRSLDLGLIDYASATGRSFD